RRHGAHQPARRLDRRGRGRLLLRAQPAAPSAGPGRLPLDRLLALHPALGERRRRSGRALGWHRKDRVRYSPSRPVGGERRTSSRVLNERVPMTARKSVLDLIGGTPLIRLNKASELTGCEIYGKAEFLNPGQSVKDRAALGMVMDARE